VEHGAAQGLGHGGTDGLGHGDGQGLAHGVTQGLGQGLGHGVQTGRGRHGDGHGDALYFQQKGSLIGQTADCESYTSHTR